VIAFTDSSYDKYVIDKYCEKSLRLTVDGNRLGQLIQDIGASMINSFANQRYIANSHFSGDHIGGNGELKPATILAHEMQAWKFRNSVANFSQ